MSSIDDDLERRLENWARWYWGGGAGATGVASIYGFGRGGHHYSHLTSIPPVINGEAMDTATAIHRLDGEEGTGARPLADVLRARYLRVAPTGYVMHTDSEIQAASALYISYDTYLRRLHKARAALLYAIRTRERECSLKIQA